MTSRQPTRIRTLQGTVWTTSDIAPARLRQLLADPVGLMHAYFHRPVKISHTAMIVQAELPLVGRGIAVAYKQYRPRNGWNGWLGRFRASAARRTWRRAMILETRKIATARPLLLLEPSRGRFAASGASYLATEWIPQAENLHLYGWRLADLPPAERFARAARCAEAVGRLVGQMHAAGVSNRDLKGANVLLAENDGTPAAYLIDPDGVRLRRRLTRRRRARELARLAVGLQAHRWASRTLCARFLRCYLAQQPRERAGEFAALWRMIARDAAAFARRMQRRGEAVL